jgi:hypothetical protein
VERFVIDPSVAVVLRSPYAKRKFFSIYLLLLAFVLLLLFVLVQSLDQNGTARAVAISFLGNFASAIAIVIVTYGFFVYVTPPGLRNAEVVPLRNVEIGEQIFDLRAGVSDYWFWGRSGGYFRQHVLPSLNTLAERDRRHVVVRIVVPDYSQPENAVRYAKMRRGLNEAADEHTLAANVIATVATAVSEAARNPYFQVQIGLCASVPVLRYDISNIGALITRDAPSLPAILINSGNPYFETFRDAVENELAQARTVKWDETADAFRGKRTRCRGGCALRRNRAAYCRPSRH